MSIRLQKFIAQSGRASRREAESWIQAGRITVNGQLVTELGTKVDPEKDVVMVDGELLEPVGQHYYYVFNKPRNVLVARSDPRKRPIIYDYLTDLPTLLHSVGRLDFDSEGLLLLTNDGELQNFLTHPSSEVPKTYHVKVQGVMTETTANKLLRGIQLEDGWATATDVGLLKSNPNNCWIEIAVTEGRNRIVRRLCEAVGHSVLRLIRVAIGPVELNELKLGKSRALKADEVAALRQLQR